MIVEHDLLSFLRSLKDRVIWTAVASTLPSIAILLSIVYNCLDLVPECFTFLVPIFSRIFWAVSACMTFIIFTGFLQQGENNPSSSGNPEKQERLHFNFWKGFSRLLFPLYLTNYTVIRYMFFSSRQSLSTHFVSLVSLRFTQFNWFSLNFVFFSPQQVTQVTSTLSFIFLFAFLAQIFLLSPLEYARKSLMNYLAKRKIDWSTLDSSMALATRWKSPSVTCSLIVSHRFASVFPQTEPNCSHHRHFFSVKSSALRVD